MTKCVYCGKIYDIPKGLTFIMKDGTIKHFCSSKCKKNMFMKRRKVKWILKPKKIKQDKDEIKDEIKDKIKDKIKTKEVKEVKEVKEDK